MSHPIPGQRPGISITPRDVLLSYESLRYGRGVIDSHSIDGANTDHEDELRPGTPLGQITATKLWTPCKRTTATSDETDATSLAVTDARAFQPGDSIKVGSNSAQAIVSVDYETNTIALTSAATWSAGDAVIAQDGSQTARAILNEFIKLKDEDGIARNKTFGQAILAGLVDNTQILGDLAAIRADSGNRLAFIQWGDDAGQV
jgi:hypothetical protein